MNCKCLGCAPCTIRLCRCYADCACVAECISCLCAAFTDCPAGRGRVRVCLHVGKRPPPPLRNPLARDGPRSSSAVVKSRLVLASPDTARGCSGSYGLQRHVVLECGSIAPARCHVIPCCQLENYMSGVDLEQEERSDRSISPTPQYRRQVPLEMLCPSRSSCTSQSSSLL